MASNEAPAEVKQEAADVSQNKESGETVGNAFYDLSKLSFEEKMQLSEIKKTLPKIPPKANLKAALTSSVETCIHKAAKSRNPKNCEEVIKGKSALEVLSLVNYSDRNGSTALFHSAWNGDLAVCKFLLNHGAEVNWQNVRNNTPLDMALETIQMETVALLVEAGAEITKEKWKEVLGRMKLKREFKPDTVKMLKKTMETAAKKGGKRNSCWVEKRRPNPRFEKTQVGLYMAAADTGTVLQDMPDQHLLDGHFDQLPDEYKAKLYWIFDDCDLNRDCVVDVEEVFNMNKRLDDDNEEDLMKDALEFMDWVDKDKNRRVSLKEWIDAWEDLARRDGILALDNFIQIYANSIGFNGQVV